MEKQINKITYVLKQTPKNIKTNALNIRVVHLWFANIDNQFILDPYATTSYYTSYITKLDKSITSKQHSIIKNALQIQEFKCPNVFFNAQQMVAQLVAYLVFFLLLYHSFRTFQFINISLSKERAFVLKSQVALNELKPNSTDIMCSSIVNKYINCPNQYELLSLAKFSFFYNIKKNSKHCKP